jgi:hypothetical protein
LEDCPGEISILSYLFWPVVGNFRFGTQDQSESRSPQGYSFDLDHDS